MTQYFKYFTAKRPDGDVLGRGEIIEWLDGGDTLILENTFRVPGGYTLNEIEIFGQLRAKTKQKFLGTIGTSTTRKNSTRRVVLN